MDEKEQLIKIISELQWCRDSITRLQSNADSERDVRRDTHTEINKKIDKIEHEIKSILFGNGKLGIIIEIDRLKQFKKVFYWIAGVVVGILIKMLVDFIAGK